VQRYSEIKKPLFKVHYFMFKISDFTDFAHNITIFKHCQPRKRISPCFYAFLKKKNNIFFDKK